MEKLFDLPVHYTKNFRAARAYYNDDNKIGVVCFIFVEKVLLKGVV